MNCRKTFDVPRTPVHSVGTLISQAYTCEVCGLCRPHPKPHTYSGHPEPVAVGGAGGHHGVHLLLAGLGPLAAVDGRQLLLLCILPHTVRKNHKHA